MVVARWCSSIAVVGFAAAAIGMAPPASGAQEPEGAKPEAGQLDVLFVGAHPDDEAGTLSTLGQWNSDHDIRSGVVTVTRGEGGGNAVGTEEGPELGELREAEERSAVGRAGVTEVLNLDKADFYYTVSAPLTEQAWGHEDSLGKLVRLVRMTQPKVVITMDPAPTPGNHGHHQYAARLATEAYQAAADPSAFPGQLTEEGLSTWSVDRLFSTAAKGSADPGPGCEEGIRPEDPVDRIWGIWAGRTGPDGKTWAQVEQEAKRDYVSQGWGGFPDAPSDPAEITCDQFVQLDSRVPYRADAKGSEGMLGGALLDGGSGLPRGTGLTAEAERAKITAGTPTTVTVAATAPQRQPLRNAHVDLAVGEGWQVRGDGRLGTVAPGKTASAEFVVTAPEAAEAQSFQLPATLSTKDASGGTEVLLKVVAPLVAEQEPLPQVAEFDSWAQRVGYPELADRVARVLTLPSGGSRKIDVPVRNHSTEPVSGQLRVDLPEGFDTSTPTVAIPEVPAGEQTSVAFEVTNTDAGLETGMQGGAYGYELTVEPDAGNSSSTSAGLELVPRTEIPQAAQQPNVDGQATDGEYPGPELDLSGYWEGEECASAQDCSATAQLSWHSDTLYALVNVVDDKPGNRLPEADCKRHWRSDSVELTIDPAGDSENTSSTMKLAAFPATADGGPCYFRDADNHQGGPDTAPGVEIASEVSEPYEGYTVELAVPLDEVPGPIDPEALGLNLLVYDSDTQDNVGKTRIGWSTWGGVQGDPYRWGQASLADYQPAPDQPETPEPELPLDALSSLDSPQSIEQSVRTGLPLGGVAAAPKRDSAWLSGATGADGAVSAELTATGAGSAHLHVLDADGAVLGREVLDVDGPGKLTARIPVDGGAPARVVAGFQNASGAVAASAAEVAG
ncbi:alpha-galactosidase-like protein [Tamaricihabitans halophyticus]|uniref:Alpha-galactosidase-like protein n=1 Tax=Tamaricihabitans halophyticus TaxID=1262583 RepID=A0A4R2R5U2_9PSEU|nr:sugar-binding protein [Tamaricihabitans halophyticus]TCP54951.1 alpha-galactosidase-like protein [Tamaricihabitans halophyticus]